MTEVDVAIVGAGFAGLAAADLLAHRGRRVQVIEARERVGGRVATVALADGTAIDLGGQWLGPSQDRMYALCRRFGREVYPMHTEGANLLRLGGTNRHYRGHIPFRTPIFTLVNLGWVLARLELLSRRIPLEAPWEAPDAAVLDQQTLGDWVRRNIPDRHARAIVRVGIEAVFAADADELSLLHALFYMRSGGGFDALTRSEAGAQQDRISGGIEPLAAALAASIREAGGIVALSQPVASIAQDDAGVTITSQTSEVRARFAVVAVPPPLAAEISFSPALSPEKASLLSRTPMGAVIKCVAIYERPYWRDKGLSGASISDEGPVHATFDASPKSGRPGVMLGFIEGPAARELARASEEERRRLVIGCFERCFGKEAREPLRYLDRAWTEEPFSRGCYAALFPPGVWTRFGRSLRRPEGRIHWAGTETSAIWNGYIEGAVRSGERAAEEIMARV
jgi:monoamine oxidase